MSSQPDASAVKTRTEKGIGHWSSARIVALVGVIMVLSALLAVLHEILGVTGDPTLLYPLVLAAGLAGTVLARLIAPRTAAGIGIVALLAGTYVYVTSLPGGFGFFVLLTPMLDDTVALLSGLSILRIVNADVWALAAAPGPVFLAWYLGLKRYYTAASVVGGGALGILVLTGDASTTMTLIGVLGVTLTVAAGDCDTRNERIENVEGVVVLLTAMVVLSMFVGVVPGAADVLISADGIGEERATMESSLVHAGDSMTVVGDVHLSPTVRFTVEADREAYWRVGTYDRYTGDGWVRTGDRRQYTGRLRGPPGPTRGLDQQFTAESPVATLPAANNPVAVRDVPVPVEVTNAGAFQPASILQPGESYAIESQQPIASPPDLRTADTDYPDAIEDQYTQLPQSTPNRVGDLTSQLTTNADNPYDTASALQQFFHEEYNYTLDVERPSDDIADTFLFERDAGYCTYFATTMVTMLRSQNIPARFVVGYSPGQPVDENEWVVRGYNSHAWVEVYFPDHGWVEFDPTPPAPRETAERQQLEEARGNPEIPTSDIDTNQSRDTDANPDPGDPEGARPQIPDNGSQDGSIPQDSDDDGSSPGAGGEGGDDGGMGIPFVPVPSPRQFGVGVLLLAGGLACVRGLGVDTWMYREVWLRHLPGGSPEETVTGAYRRVVYLEERDGYEKPPGATPRQYFADASPPARRIAAVYERAMYGPGVTEAAADEVQTQLAKILDTRSRIPHRIGKRDTESR